MNEPKVVHLRPRGVPAGVLVAVGAGALVGGLVLLSLLGWQTQVSSQRRALATAAMEARLRLDAIPARKDSLGDRLARAAELGTVVFSETGPAAPGALGNLLSELGDLAGVRFRSVRVSADTSRWEGFQELIASAEASMNSESLMRILFLIERSRPVLSVRELTVSPQGAYSSGDPTAGLRIELKVAALAPKPTSIHD